MKKNQHTIDEQIKLAERDKYLAEAEKANSERKKIDFELAQSIKENGKPFFLKKDFRNNFVKIFVGLGFLGFYIIYAAIPIINRDNILLSIENAKTQKKLVEGQGQLHIDSINIKNEQNVLLCQIKYIDSLKLGLEK